MEPETEGNPNVGREAASRLGVDKILHQALGRELAEQARMRPQSLSTPRNFHQIRIAACLFCRVGWSAHTFGTGY